MKKPRHRKRVDQAAVHALWKAGMDTYAIAQITGCLEVDVYHALARIDRRRCDQDHPSLSTQRKPSLEDICDGRNVSVIKVHHMAQNSHDAGKNSSQRQDSLRAVQVNTRGGKTGQT